MGKTADLIRLAAANNIPILTAYSPKYIEDLAKRMGCNVTVFTIYDLKTGKHRGRNIKEMYVDEADAVLNTVLNSEFYITAALGTLSIEG